MLNNYWINKPSEFLSTLPTGTENNKSVPLLCIFLLDFPSAWVKKYCQTLCYNTKNINKMWAQKVSITYWQSDNEKRWYVLLLGSSFFRNLPKNIWGDRGTTWVIREQGMKGVCGWKVLLRANQIKSCALRSSWILRQTESGCIWRAGTII